MQCERNNAIAWQKDKCVMCQMSLKIEATSFKTPDDEMTYGDSFIRFEHKFLRNIYSYEQIKETDFTEVSDFIFDNYRDDTVDELKNRIMQTEIKNAHNGYVLF